MLNVLSINKFQRALNDNAKADAINLSIGESVLIDVNNGIINGVIEDFIDEDVILKIGNKSTFAINAKSILKISIINRRNTDGGEG